MSLARISGKALCGKCFQGKMIFLKERAEGHGFFQCSHCGKIDELAILKGADGKSSLFLMPKEWEEVLDESVEGLIHQLQGSAKDVGAWRDGKPVALEKLQSAISGWKEFQHIIYYFPLAHPGDELAKFPWQFTFVEADRELAASRSLAALGFYKDAFKALRSYLELILFGLFIFSRNDQQYFREWFSGTKQAPSITGKTGLISLVCGNKHLSLEPFISIPNLAAIRLLSLLVLTGIWAKPARIAFATRVTQNAMRRRLRWSRLVFSIRR
jgi:hypothetical protein